MMKENISLFSPIYPPILPSKPSLAPNRDDHLMPFLYHDRFTFRVQRTSLFMHPADYNFRLYDKNQVFLHPLLQR